MFKFFKDTEELECDYIYDSLSNDEIGDLIGFAEKVIELEQDDKLTFTKQMDRDEELADLFRFCMANYRKGSMNYSFTEYTEELLLQLEEKAHPVASKRKHVSEGFDYETVSIIMPVGYHEVIECCPECGKEIDMILPKGTERIPFCPHCGEKQILLCSECMAELGDCQPSASCAYCHGHPNGKN